MRLFRIGLILFFLSATISNSWSEAGELIRVAIALDAPEIELRVASPYQIFCLKTNKELYKGNGFWRAKKVLPAEAGIRIDEFDFKVYGVRIQPSKSPAVYINGRKFRGAMDIICQPNKTLLVINRVDLEGYVCGVLSEEVSVWWSMEALKSQAIVARTFALYQARGRADKDYDLSASSASQAYGGMASERARTTKAVQLTTDKILTYKSELFPTFYHATCAGHTENAASLWKIDLVPLRGRQCQFCRRSPHFKWTAEYSFGELEAALKKAGLELGAIQSIKVIDRDISGRVTNLEIASANKRLKISGNRLRNILGSNLVKSTNFKLGVKKGLNFFNILKPLPKVYFKGTGWGHGVGMCQWGAFFMAKEGFNAEQILDYYYPESKIRNITDVQ